MDAIVLMVHTTSSFD